MNLQTLRTQIDRIDRRLLRLLNQRATLAVRVGRLKRRQGRPVFDRTREAQVLRRLARTNPGPFSGEAIQHVFRQILRQSRRLEANRHR